jgi:hypothetical protein
VKTSLVRQATNSLLKNSTLVIASPAPAFLRPSGSGRAPGEAGASLPEPAPSEARGSPPPCEGRLAMTDSTFFHILLRMKYIQQDGVSGHFDRIAVVEFRRREGLRVGILVE